jgi:hypothetical protein
MRISNAFFGLFTMFTLLHCGRTEAKKGEPCPSRNVSCTEMERSGCIMSPDQRRMCVTGIKVEEAVGRAISKLPCLLSRPYWAGKCE